MSDRGPSRSWEERSKQATQKMIFMFLGFVLVAGVYFYMEYSAGNSISTTNIIMLSCFFGFLAIMFIGVKLYIRKKSKEEKEKIGQYSQFPPEERTQQVLDQADLTIRESRDQWHYSTPRYETVIRKRREIGIRDYNGELVGKTCGICKLELRRKQKVLQCVSCLSLFHEKHLKEWLATNTNCPICGNLLID